VVLGHLLEGEVLWMDPVAAEKGPAEYAEDPVE
jgi:hypothetical protein